MYDTIPQVEEISEDLLLSVSRKGFLRAGLSPDEWNCWWDDARQVAWLSLLETAGQPDAKRIARAKWRVFEFVIGHIYGQMTDWVHLPDRDDISPLESGEPIEWTLVVNRFAGILSPEYTAVAVWLLLGKSNYEIAELCGYKNEDSARAMVSKVRRHISEILGE